MQFFKNHVRYTNVCSSELLALLATLQLRENKVHVCMYMFSICFC